MKFIMTLQAISVSLLSLAQVPKIEDGKLILENPVTFKTAGAELTDEGKDALQPVKAFLLQKDYITTLRIEGPLDNTISADAAQKLTEKRAMAVCKWLVENGIDCNRLIAVDFGNTKPIVSNDDPMSKAQNRRMEFVLAAMRGKAIGGMPMDGGGIIAGDVCK